MQIKVAKTRSDYKQIQAARFQGFGRFYDVPEQTFDTTDLLDTTCHVMGVDESGLMLASCRFVTQTPFELAEMIPLEDVFGTLGPGTFEASRLTLCRNYPAPLSLLRPFILGIARLASDMELTTGLLFARRGLWARYDSLGFTAYRKHEFRTALRGGQRQLPYRLDVAALLARLDPCSIPDVA